MMIHIHLSSVLFTDAFFVFSDSLKGVGYKNKRTSICRVNAFAYFMQSYQKVF